MTDLPPVLQFADAPPAPETANFLIFGPVGSGKSTATARLGVHGPILWLNLEGPGALAYPRMVSDSKILEVQINTAEVKKPGQDAGLDVHAILREFVRYARSGDPRPATVVIDTIGKLRDALAAQYVVPNARDSRSQWGEVAKIIRGALTILRDLPVNLVLIAHQDISEGEDGDGRLIRPKIGGALTEDIPADMDVVAYTSLVVAQDDPNDPATRRKEFYGQLADAKGRQGLKDRSNGLGIYRELDLAEWLSTYRAAFAQGLEVPVDESDIPWSEDAEPTEPEAQASLTDIQPAKAAKRTKAAA